MGNHYRAINLPATLSILSYYLTDSSQHPKVDTLVIPILHMRTLRQRSEVMEPGIKSKQPALNYNALLHCQGVFFLAQCSNSQAKMPFEITPSP